MLIGIFQQIDNDGLEGIVFLLQFVNRFLEDFPCHLPARPPALHRDFIPNGNHGGIHEPIVAIGIQHQRIREPISECGFPTERRTINPNDALCDGFDVPPLVFGQFHKIVPSFLTILLKFTIPTKIASFRRKFPFFIRCLYPQKPINHFLHIVLDRLHTDGNPV